MTYISREYELECVDFMKCCDKEKKTTTLQDSLAAKDGTSTARAG